MHKVLIVGAGLSGLTAALLIRSSIDADITIIDQGKPYNERVSAKECNMLSGVGGAGTVGGGKLCFPPASTEIWKKTRFSQHTFSAFLKSCIIPFCPKEIDMKSFANIASIMGEGLYQKKYDSFLLSKSEMNQFVTRLIEKVLALGITINTDSIFKKIETNDDGSFMANYIVHGQKVIQKYDVVILASGRSSASQISSWLPSGVTSENKSPDLGFRFSLTRTNNDAFHAVGKDVKIKAAIGNIGVRTFCVCSGGDKVLVNTNTFQYYDGHFDSGITEFSNLGLMARSKKIMGYKYAALYCSYLKRYLYSGMTLDDFVKYWDKLIPETSIFNDVLESLAVFVKMLQENQIILDGLNLCPVYLPSVDNLNPVIKINRYFETECPNFYVIGDASGISRGFIQAMWSARCASVNIVKNANLCLSEIRSICAI